MPALNYGHSQLSFNLPPGKLLGVLEGLKMPPAPDFSAAVIDSLTQPIGAPALNDFAKEGEKIVICVPDKTRDVKLPKLLPLVISEIKRSGAHDDDIAIVFARGTHLPHTRAEQARLVGQEIADRIELFDHDSEDNSNLDKVGITSRGNEVWVNKMVAEADKRVLISGINYHYFAGFGGGRKMILPGVCGYQTIQNNHKLVLEEIKKYGRRTYAVTGNLTKNPVHEDMLEAIHMLGPTFAVNVLLNPEKKLAKVFSGDVIQSHLVGCETLNQYACVPVKEKADLVIVSAGGYPKDIDFVQAHKAMENASYVLKDGGVMVVLAEAEQGFPTAAYLKWAQLGRASEIVDDLRRQFLISKHTIYAAVKKAETFKIIWVTKMDYNHVKQMQMIPVPSMGAALKEAQKYLLPEPSIYVIPQGYNTLALPML
ncbi:MAG: nickel-dependent lactate racemase [Candidatus Margulisiibacteriota bacterium]